MYSPDRILHPLRRIGPKGSGEFERISWDDTLAEIATRLHDVIDTHGAEAILPFSDAGNQSLLAMQGVSGRFFNHLGASRLVRAICGPTVGAGVSMTNGSALGMDPLEIRHAKLIILWATNTKLTNRHLWPTIEAARADGAKIVVIDPIRTATAEAADWFLQPRPGTDIALMLAMTHVLIRDGLVDDAWVAAHTTGFDELAGIGRRMDARAGRDAPLASRSPTSRRSLATTERPVRLRSAHSSVANTTRTGRCSSGRSPACPPSSAHGPTAAAAWRAASAGGRTSSATSRALDRPDLLGDRSPRWFNMSRLGEALTESDPPVHAMIVWNCNPLVIVPNAELTRRGLERDDLFTIVHEQFLTDTARYADIVLPATTQIEATDVVLAWGHLWMGWNEAAIAPLGESVTNAELFRRIAGAMGLDEPSLYDDDETILRESLPSVDLDALRRDGWVRVPYPDDGRPWGSWRVPDGVRQGRAGQ